MLLSNRVAKSLQILASCGRSAGKFDPAGRASYSNSSVTLERLEGRRLVRVRGTDAVPFLHGLITNDMNHFQHGANSIYAMLLNTSGRVLYDTLIYRVCDNEKVDHFLVECDTSIAEKLQKHFNMFRVRKKVEIASSQQNIWVAFVHGSPDSNAPVPTRQYAGEGAGIYKDTRVTDLGYRIITDATSSVDSLKELFPSTVAFDSSVAYTEHRYALGIGEGVENIPPGKSFPLECNCDYMHGVSFHKGCYIGQELTARTHHTGVVRKRLMPLIFDSSVSMHNLAEDAQIKSKDGEIVGKLRGCSGSAGLGLLRIEKVSPACQPLVVADKYHCTTHRPLWWPKEQQRKP